MIIIYDMAIKITKTFTEILGKRYPVDEFTNITPRIIDNTLRKLHEQSNNPLYLVSERIRHFFKDKSPDEVGSKYQEFKFDSPIVTIEDNFDSLLVPKDHVSRRKADSYYLNSNHLLRSHTSAHQNECLKRGSKAFITIADCYRRDEIDRSHFPTFHQCEILKLYNHKEAGLVNQQNLYDAHLNETDSKQRIYSQEASSFVEQRLKSTIESFVKQFFNNSKLETRWVSAYFPFTHPSFELEILWNGKWLEVLGCGVVRDEILKACGAFDHIGFAIGFGLERFAMLKYEIPDIRLFWTRDSGFLHQFESKSCFDTFQYKPISQCPQCINDLSFWLPQDNDKVFESNDFYDLCRSVTGELIEQVRLVDDFIHPKTKRRSLCYRIVYRATDRVLTKDEVNHLHEEIGNQSERKFNIVIRK